MDEELEQEVPELTDEQITETKKDPFVDILDGGDGIEGTEGEQIPNQTVDGTQSDGLSELELQQLLELMQQQNETTTSIPVDVVSFNTAINNLTVELSSVMLFCAFLVAGTMAAIKLWGSRL